MSRSRTFVLLVVVLFTCIGPLVAQGVPTDYVIISNRPANARSCPRLDCAVVTTFAPGTVLSSTGTSSGDAVAGSDQWVQIDFDGKTAYVHESLVELAEAPATTASAEQTSAADEAPNTVNTSQWVEHSGHGVSLMAPPSWMEIGAYLQDEEYWDDYTQTHGADAAQNLRSWAESAYQAYLNGECQMVIKEPYGSGLLVIESNPTDSSIIPRDVMLEMLRSGLEAAGAEIIEMAPVDLPAGEGTHIFLRWDGWLEEDYIIFAADTDYFVELTMDPLHTARYAGWAAAIAQSFHLEETAPQNGSAT